jgi:hypothetical protein
MAEFPAETVTLAGLPAIVKLAAKTTWFKTVEALAANMESPPYAAVTECVPTVSVDVVKVATALLFKAPVPSAVVPSRNVTVPLGVPGLLDVIVAVNVTAVPLDTEVAELTNTAVVVASVIVSVIAAEVLPAKFPLPAYLQVIECVPTASVEVVKVATPLLLSVPLPSVAVPSRKVTLPVGVPELLDVMVAVNVSGLPLDAEAVEATMVVVVAAAATEVMVSVIATEVLLAKFPPPAYLQVIECVPTVSVEVVNVATPLPFNVPAPSAVVPSRNVTVPLSVPELLDVMVAVNVTGAPLDAETPELTSTAVVAACVIVSVAAVEVLAVKLESPPYAAVMECVPTVSVEIAKVALPPLFSVPMPSVIVPSRKVIAPVGVPLPVEVTVAVNVTGVP